MDCSDSAADERNVAALAGRRILYVCEYSTLHGGERSLLAWLPAVTQARCQVRFITPGTGRLAAAVRGLGIPVEPWDADRPNSSSGPLLQRRKRIAEIFRTWRPDLVHANSLSMSRAVGPIAEQSGVPSIGHLRDIVRISARAMRDVNCNSRILAVSQAAADWHLARGLAAGRTHVLYNGVDLEQFAPRPATHYLHRELSLPPEVRLIGSIGQIGVRKGLDVLLSAAGIIANSFADVHFLVVGRRQSQKDEAIEFERQLHRRAADSALRGRVHFLGYRDEVSRLLNELTLLIHAARQEPLGRVLLEAAASGVPVVATDVGGAGEIFPDGEAALVPSDDPLAICSAAAGLLRGPPIAIVQAARARRRMRQRFDVADSAASLLRHYRDVSTQAATLE